MSADKTDSIAEPTKPRRRWVQFGLRTLLLIITAFAIWLGWQAHRARIQRDAVAAILKIGGIVLYDYEAFEDPSGTSAQLVYDQSRGPTAPPWLRTLIGEDYFRRVVRAEVIFNTKTRHRDPEALALLAQISSLQELDVEIDESELSEAINVLQQFKQCNNLRQLIIGIQSNRTSSMPHDSDAAQSEAAIENWLNQTQPMRDFRSTLAELQKSLLSADIICVYHWGSLFRFL